MDTDVISAGDKLPRIQSLKVEAPHALKITWKDGATDAADLSAVVERFKPFAPLKDPAVFASAEIINWGSGIEWASVGLDYSAFRLKQIADEQTMAAKEMTAAEFVAWLSSADLTVPLAASLLGMGRRQIIKYRNEQAKIPRAVQMVVRQLQKEPGRINALLPTVK